MLFAECIPCQLSTSPSHSKFRTRFMTLRQIAMTIAGSNYRTEITLQPPSFVSEKQFVGYGLYGRIALLLDDPSRCFKFCEPDNQRCRRDNRTGKEHLRDPLGLIHPSYSLTGSQNEACVSSIIRKDHYGHITRRCCLLSPTSAPDLDGVARSWRG